MWQLPAPNVVTSRSGYILFDVTLSCLNMLGALIGPVQIKVFFFLCVHGLHIYEVIIFREEVGFADQIW